MPRIVSVGDVIRIRRFKFFIDDTSGKLIGKELLFSNWMVFNLQTMEKYSEKKLKDEN